MRQTGGTGVGGDLHQVEIRFVGHAQGFAGGDHPDVFTCRIDQPYFGNSYGLIYSKFVGADTSLLAK